LPYADTEGTSTL